MKLRLVNVSDVDEAMHAQLRAWRNSDVVSPFFLLDQVTEEQHHAWLKKNIRGENACACVIYADQVRSGWCICRGLTGIPVRAKSVFIFITGIFRNCGLLPLPMKG